MSPQARAWFDAVAAFLRRRPGTRFAPQGIAPIPPQDVSPSPAPFLPPTVPTIPPVQPPSTGVFTTALPPILPPPPPPPGTFTPNLPPIPPPPPPGTFTPNLPPILPPPPGPGGFSPHLPPYTPPPPPIPPVLSPNLPPHTPPPSPPVFTPVLYPTWIVQPVPIPAAHFANPAAAALDTAPGHAAAVLAFISGAAGSLFASQASPSIMGASSVLPWSDAFDVSLDGGAPAGGFGYYNATDSLTFNANLDYASELHATGGPTGNLCLFQGPRGGIENLAVTITCGMVAPGGYGVGCRCSGTSYATRSGYEVIGGGANLRLYRVDAGVATELDFAAVGTFQGDTLRITCSGTTISVYLNAVLQISVTDGTYATGYPAIVSSDEWSIQDFAVAAN